MAFDVFQGGVAQLLTSSGWQLNTPYYIAATFDAATGTMMIYRDGNLVASRNDLAHTNMSTTVGTPYFQIGRNIDNGANDWNGLIDEVQFYNHALTQSEIASLVPEPATWAIGVLSVALLLAFHYRNTSKGRRNLPRP